MDQEAMLVRKEENLEVGGKQGLLIDSNELRDQM